MNSKEVMHYWYYFCSLCSQLNATRNYVDHRTTECNGIQVLANANTYSNEFLKILLSTASEFETVGKLLCKEISPGFNEKSNIVHITDTITKQYPNIGQTIVTTDFQVLTPLLNWSVQSNDCGQNFITGLPWWTAYTDVKHHRYDCFNEATLEHCIDALASLLVLELYLAMKVTGSVSNLSTHSCEYFHFRYGHEQFWVRCPQNLPDFL